MLSEEVKWLAITHKGFDQGRRGFNDRLTNMGIDATWGCFQHKLSGLYGQDTNNHGKRFDDLENRVKRPEGGTAATGRRCRKEAGNLVYRTKKKKKAIVDLGNKLEQNSKRAGRRDGKTHSSGELNHHSPSGVNVRVNHGRDILVNPSSETSQFLSHTLTFTNPLFNPVGGLILANTGPWITPSPAASTLSYSPLTPKSTHHCSKTDSEGHYNTQHLPAINLSFSRTTPGSLLSKSKTSDYRLSIDGRGGQMGSVRKV